MDKALDFITYALMRAKPESVPEGAILAIPLAQVGTAASGPWEYLMGTTGKTVTQALLDERYKNYYQKQHWKREDYDNATAGWVKAKKTVCDCQGLLDSFLKLDVNAHYCYTSWCTETGSIEKISRDWVIGEAVFRVSDNRMVHVGWVCGFLGSEPLVVEARGIRYGVVVTKLSERGWTHRGLVTKKLDYSPEEIVEEEVTYRFDLTSPRQNGTEVMVLQEMLRVCGYTDDEGKLLDVDGKLGPKTWQALMKFLRAHISSVMSDPVPPETHTVMISTIPLTIMVDGAEVSIV